MARIELVVSPQARRDAVKTLVTERPMGVPLPSGLAPISRWLFHYESRRRINDEVLIARMTAIAAHKRRYGHHRIHVVLNGNAG